MTDEQTNGPAEGNASMPDPAHPELAAGATGEAETAEGGAGPDPSNTPVENLVEDLPDGEEAEVHQRLGLRGDATIAEHTDEALVLREATSEEKAGQGTGEAATGDGA